MKIGDRGSGSGHDDAKEAKAASFLFGAQIRLLPYYRFGTKRVQGGNPRLLAMLTIDSTTRRVVRHYTASFQNKDT